MNSCGGLALEEEAFFPDFNSQENFKRETFATPNFLRQKPTTEDIINIDE